MSSEFSDFVSIDTYILDNNFEFNYWLMGHELWLIILKIHRFTRDWYFTLILKEFVNKGNNSAHVPEFYVCRGFSHFSNSRVHSLFPVTGIAIDQLVNRISALFQRQANTHIGREWTEIQKLPTTVGTPNKGTPNKGISPYLTRNLKNGKEGNFEHSLIWHKL